MFNRTTHLARLSCGNLAKFGHRKVLIFTMCLLPRAFAHTSHASRSEIEVQLVACRLKTRYKHVKLLRITAFAQISIVLFKLLDVTVTAVRVFSAGTVHSERLFGKKFMFHCITLFSCTGVTGEMTYALMRY